MQHYNELKNSFRTDRSLEAKLTAAGRSLELAGKNMKRWEARRIKTRRGVSFFFISSSYVNAGNGVLGEDWFTDEFAEGLEGLECNVLSIIPKLEAGQMFYCNLVNHQHF